MGGTYNAVPNVEYGKGVLYTIQARTTPKIEAYKEYSRLAHDPCCATEIRSLQNSKDDTGCQEVIMRSWKDKVTDTDSQEKVKIFLVLALASIGCICVAALAAKPVAVLLAAGSSLLVAVAAYLERDWLRLTPLPPLTAICVCGWLRSGIGGTLMALSTEDAQNDALKAMWDFLPETQLLWMCIMAAAIILFAWKKPIKPKSRSARWDDDRSNTRRLVQVTVLCGVFALAWIIVGNIYGTLDRTPEKYLHWVARSWRPDSYFVLFSRFRDVFFISAPLAIQKSRGWIRACIIGSILVYLSIALPLGGRGLVMWPIIYIWCGLLITGIQKRLLVLATIVLLVTGLTVLPAIQLYKYELQTVSELEEGNSRYNAAQAAIRATMGQGLLSDGKYWRDLGRPIYGCVDGLLFEKPASEKPRAGLARIENVLTAWIPGTLFPRKLPVRDAHLIAAEASGLSREEAEEKVYTSHDCISFGGDMYWRGGWGGVILGSFGFAGLLRVFSSFWYRFAGNEQWWSILLMLYPTTFLQAMPLGSLGETAWSWTWELPKYIAIVVAVFLLRSGVKRGRTIK